MNLQRGTANTEPVEKEGKCNIHNIPFHFSNASAWSRVKGTFSNLGFQHEEG